MSWIFCKFQGHAWSEQPWPALEPGVRYEETSRGRATLMGFSRYMECERCGRTKWERTPEP